MIDYQLLYQALEAAGADEWARLLPSQLERAFANQSHGDLPRWQKVVEEFPQLAVNDLD
jgi:hypothetical protein